MGSNVSLQEPGPGEALATVGTFAALVVGSHMHREGRHRDINLIAVGTTSGFLVTQWPVCLTVSGQVAGGAVSFSAVRAAVCFGLKKKCVPLRDTNSGIICLNYPLILYLLKFQVELMRIYFDRFSASLRITYSSVNSLKNEPTAQSHEGRRHVRNSHLYL